MMKYSLIKCSLQVIIMLAFFSKAFGFSSLSNEDIQLKPRQINLSGEIVSFSMPENFSADMPIKEMIESVNLADDSVFEDYRKFTLIRRYWDFKDKGYFGFFEKGYGSLMMSIYIKKAPENSEYDILNPLEFVGTIIRNFDEISRNESLENNNEAPSNSYPNFYEAYKIQTINSLHWFSYPIESNITGRLDINYAIPITPQHYIVVKFSFAPNNNVSTRQFIEEHGRPHMDAIMNTFAIQFSAGSQLPSINSQPIDLDKLIADKFYSQEKPVQINDELLNSIQHIKIK